jgi:hypothetical protein
METVPGVTLTAEECVCVDDMAGARRIVCHGSGVLAASPEDYTAQ